MNVVVNGQQRNNEMVRRRPRLAVPDAGTLSSPSGMQRYNGSTCCEMTIEDMVNLFSNICLFAW
jgi:hypothetical protein